MKWIGLQATFVHIQAKLGQENLLRMVRWMRWQRPPDTGFEIRAMAVRGRARYLSVTEAPTILSFTRGWGRNIFVSFKPPRSGTEPRTQAWKAAVLTTTLGPPPDLAGTSKMWNVSRLFFVLRWWLVPYKLVILQPRDVTDMILEAPLSLTLWDPQSHPIQCNKGMVISKVYLESVNFNEVLVEALAIDEVHGLDMPRKIYV